LTFQRRIPLNLDPYLGILKEFFDVVREGHFCTIWLVSLKMKI